VADAMIEAKMSMAQIRGTKSFTKAAKLLHALAVSASLDLSAGAQYKHLSVAGDIPTPHCRHIPPVGVSVR
jgi:hypothetical protein